MFPHSYFGAEHFPQEYFPDSSGVAPPSVTADPGAGRFEWTERRTRVRTRFEREVPAPIVEAVLEELDALPDRPAEPAIAAAVARIAERMGPYWSDNFRAGISDAVRSREISNEELATVLMLLDN